MSVNPEVAEAGALRQKTMGAQISEERRAER
jgi:hypothetical protein